jgi:hypothetical protein
VPILIFFQIFVAMLCDLLWFYRNQVVHKGVILAVASVAAHINRVSQEHYTAWSSKLYPVKEVWSEPATGFCKVNFDIAIQEAFSTQAAVCKNSKGQIIKAIAQVSPLQSSLRGSPCSQVSKCSGLFSSVGQFHIKRRLINCSLIFKQSFS